MSQATIVVSADIQAWARRVQPDFRARSEALRVIDREELEKSGWFGSVGSRRSLMAAVVSEAQIELLAVGVSSERTIPTVDSHALVGLQGEAFALTQSSSAIDLVGQTDENGAGSTSCHFGIDKEPS